MRTRLDTAKLSTILFLIFFVPYVAAAVVWLVLGLFPVLASAFQPMHETLHDWGGGEQAIQLEVSDWDGTFEQETTAAWPMRTNELTFRAGDESVISFQNHDRGVRHNLSIYTDSSAREAIFQGTVVPGPASDGDDPSRTVYRFATPPIGTYYYRCDVHPDMDGIVRVVDNTRALSSLTFAELARGIAGAAHLSESPMQSGLQYLFSVVNLCLGVLLVRLRPGDRAARFLALGMVGTGAVFNLQTHTLENATAWVDNLHEGLHLVSGVAYLYALLLFPDGNLVPGWSSSGWSGRGLRAFALVVFAFLGWMFGSTVHGEPESFVFFFGVLIPIAGVISQAFRYRHAPTVEARQLSRSLMWALSLALAAALLFGLVALVAVGIGPSLAGQPLEGLKRFVFLVFPPLFAAIPILLFVLMVRYQVWDIDRVINRALVYGALTGTLGVTYLMSVILFGALLTAIMGQRSNAVVVAASTLAVAASFQPARRRIQAFIDRRFHRPTYDAALTLAAFGTSVRDEVDLTRLSDGLLTVVNETLQPAHASLWLRPTENTSRPVRNDPRHDPPTVAG